MLHGQPGGPFDFDPLRPHLAGLRVLTPTRPGYDGRPPGGFAENAAAAAVLLRAEGIDRAVVLGYSWGGGIALRLAADEPGLVAGLVLVSSVGARSAIQPVDRLLARPLPSLLVAAAGARFGRTVLSMAVRATGSRLSSEQRHRVAANVATVDTRAAWRAWRREQRALVTENLEEVLPQVRCPAIVIAGSRDAMVPASAGRELAARLPHATFVELPGGHLLLLEQAERVAAAVRELAGG
jgi:pimeloyl-ACP methyl ester carboxylesterase